MDYHHIYARQAEEYNAMVSAEDCDRNLAAALAERLSSITSVAKVLEVGVGTGRITEILCTYGATVLGCETAPAMLAIARRRLAAYSTDQIELIETDCTGLPERPEHFDLAVAGWVFGHLRSWRAADWRTVIAANIAKTERALKPGSTLLIIETLGTGESSPRPPNPELAEYYAWLETECDFVRSEIRTDYLFPNSETAARAMEFFFGAELASRVREANWARVPECTGIWSRRKACR